MNILFLGASKRVSLFERFISSAEEIGIELQIFSCELKNDFYPISGYAKILAGPSFADSSFGDWLEDAIKKYNIDMVIPVMDSATVALGKYKLEHRSSHPWLVVSGYELCRSLEDKILAEEFFKKHGINTPANTDNRFPKIAKPRTGFGARGVQIFETKGKMDWFFNENKIEGYLVQDFIKGQETTVDFYVSPKSGLVGYVLRDRLEVSDGEVMTCITRVPSEKEKEMIEKIALLPGWCGCITLQYIIDAEGRLYIVEINPRFGGGVTCSIEAGLDIPSYLMKEFLGQSFVFSGEIKEIKMTRARRDFFKKLN